jgi:hypothetical protein
MNLTEILELIAGITATIIAIITTWATSNKKYLELKNKIKTVNQIAKNELLEPEKIKNLIIELTTTE